MTNLHFDENGTVLNSNGEEIDEDDFVYYIFTNEINEEYHIEKGELIQEYDEKLYRQNLNHICTKDKIIDGLEEIKGKKDMFDLLKNKEVEEKFKILYLENGSYWIYENKIVKIKSTEIEEENLKVKIVLENKKMETVDSKDLERKVKTIYGEDVELYIFKIEAEKTKYYENKEILLNNSLESYKIKCVVEIGRNNDIYFGVSKDIFKARVNEETFLKEKLKLIKYTEVPFNIEYGNFKYLNLILMKEDTTIDQISKHIVISIDNQSCVLYVEALVSFDDQKYMLIKDIKTEDKLFKDKSKYTDHKGLNETYSQYSIILHERNCFSDLDHYTESGNSIKQELICCFNSTDNYHGNIKLKSNIILKNQSFGKCIWNGQINGTDVIGVDCGNENKFNFNIYDHILIGNVSKNVTLWKINDVLVYLPIKDMNIEIIDFVNLPANYIEESNVLENVKKLNINDLQVILKWIGTINGIKCFGIEFKNNIEFGTNGTFQNHQLFKCTDYRGALISAYGNANKTSCIFKNKCFNNNEEILIQNDTLNNASICCIEYINNYLYEDSNIKKSYEKGNDVIIKNNDNVIIICTIDKIGILCQKSPYLELKYVQRETKKTIMISILCKNIPLKLKGPLQFNIDIFNPTFINVSNIERNERIIKYDNLVFQYIGSFSNLNYKCALIKWSDTFKIGISDVRKNWDSNDNIGGEYFCVNYVDIEEKCQCLKGKHTNIVDKIHDKDICCIKHSTKIKGYFYYGSTKQIYEIKWNGLINNIEAVGLIDKSKNNQDTFKFGKYELFSSQNGKCFLHCINKFEANYLKSTDSFAILEMEQTNNELVVIKVENNDFYGRKKFRFKIGNIQYAAVDMSNTINPRHLDSEQIKNYRMSMEFSTNNKFNGFIIREENINQFVTPFCSEEKQIKVMEYHDSKNYKIEDIVRMKHTNDYMKITQVLLIHGIESVKVYPWLLSGNEGYEYHCESEIDEKILKKELVINKFQIIDETSVKYCETLKDSNDILYSKFSIGDSENRTAYNGQFEWCGIVNIDFKCYLIRMTTDIYPECRLLTKEFVAKLKHNTTQNIKGNYIMVLKEAVHFSK